MKKKYISPETTLVNLQLQSMLATSLNNENMGSNENPGGDNDFNSNHRGGWSNYWEDPSSFE